MFMAHSAAVQQTSPTPREHVVSGLSHSLRGTLADLACKCSTKDNIDFLIKEDRVVCAFCGREILCVPPILGIFKATCSCCNSASVKSAFVLDSRGIYTCTWCGRAR